jgi:hypothetical protein
MEGPENTEKLSPEQQNTAALLERLLGQTIADRYVDFCRLAGGAYALRVSRPVAAHALRELDSMLRHVLEAPMEARTTETAADRKRIERARRLLQEAGFDEPALQRATTALKPRLSHKAQIRRIVERLGLASDGDIANQWIALTDAFGRAHERSFHRSLQVDDEFRARYQQPFDTVVRAVALALQGRYAALMQRVEELAALPNPAQGAAQFAREIPGALPLQWHFFDRLQSPAWLPYLAAEGLLGEPLAAFDQPAGMRFRQWPAGKYLLRMAASPDADARQAVADALRNVSNSRHPDVVQQGLEILAALPAEDSAPLADVAAEWLSPDSRLFTLLAPEQLVRKLAANGEPRGALQIAGALFRIWDDNGRVASLFSQHMYEHHLPPVAAALTTACGEDALRLFVGLLEQAGTISGKFRHSHFSDKPIADDTPGGHDIYDELVRAARRAAHAVVEQQPQRMPNVIASLRANPAKVFVRLALHILSLNPAAAPELATAYLSDPDLIEAGWCAHEYAELAHAWYPSLAPENQTQILQTVDALPAKYIAAWKARFEEHRKAPPSAEDERRFAAATVRDVLWKWRAVLPPERQDALAKIAAELGDPDAWRHNLFPEETSPLSGPEFATRSMSEVVAFLRAWQPQEGPQRQTITALAQELRNAASGNLAAYATAADSFDGLRPIYVRRLMEGLENAANNRHAFPWDAVLRLIERTLARAATPIDPASMLEGDDADWSWTQLAAADLLAEGLRQGASGIAFEHAARVQSLVLTMLRTAPREAGVDDFEERYARHTFFATQSTLRGKAVENAILLLFWLSKDKASAVGTDPRQALSAVPDVRQALEAELADHSPAGRIPRAIIGRFLNWLFYFGEDWLRRRMPELLPPNDDVLRAATWLSHLGHDQGPIKDLMAELHTCYAEEIARLATAADDNNDREFRQDRLGEYLVILHLWGVLPESLLDAFGQQAPVRPRQHAIWFLGTQLALPPKDLPDEMRARGFAYWERRLETARTARDPERYRAELGSIGQWCFREGVDVPWLSHQILVMLAAGFAPTDAFSVVTWIDKTASQDIDRAVALLSALLTNPLVETWAYTTQRDPIHSVLSRGLATGTAETIARARELIGFLSSIGETVYLDLIRPTAAA